MSEEKKLEEQKKSKNDLLLTRRYSHMYFERFRQTEQALLGKQFEGRRFRLEDAPIPTVICDPTLPDTVEFPADVLSEEQIQNTKK